MNFFLTLALHEEMDLDKTLRYTTAFQNQVVKACQALDSMDRLERKGAYALAAPNPPMPQANGGDPTVVTNQ